ncbi:integrase, catalytic region, zinc finger, CCHC-type containing protein [Tanacetum coccineum]|uniref:Integrase, catalytic region, zinc finger, CCHC-type containing protein n=1 Tax=Tanacetum coccineum TaxID=301880 RepID=A0ABQ4ZMV5_9ASTR
MTILAEHIIVAGAENRPPMLEKSMYDSWASRIRLFIKGKKHGRMMLDSIDNGLLVYPTVEENGQARPKLYNLFDKFAYVQGETLYEYYWRFSQLINDMHTIEMTMQQVPVNTKFLNALPSEWSKFVTDVKLAKSLYTINYDQLYAYLIQHEQHANEVRSLMYPPPQQFTPVYAAPIHHQHHHTLVNPQQHPVSPPPFISPLVTQQSQAEFPQLDSSLFLCFSKEKIRLNASTKQWHFYLNQATIQDGRVTIQQVQGRQNQSDAGTGNRGIATTSKGNVATGQPRVVKCYNCQGEGHMARQCTQPKRPRNATWFKEKLILSGVPYSDSYPNDMINQDVQEMQYSEQTHVDDFQDTKIHNGSNIIPYSQYLEESQDAVIQDTNPSAPNDLLVLFLVEQMTDHVARLDKENQTNKMVNESLTAELERYKERIAIFEQRLNESLSKTLTVFKTESKEKDSKYIDKEIVLEKENKELENIICKMYRSTQAMHMLMKLQVFYDDTQKQALGYQNPFHLKKAQRIQPTLYDGSVISKEHVVIFVVDDEETLILEE